MSLYEMNEGSFELDEADAVDATVHVFDADVGGAIARVVVERARLSDRSLVAVARRREAAETEALPGYAILAEREVVYGGMPAVEFCARFRRRDQSPTYLRRAHIATGPIELSFTMSAPFAAREACDAWMDSALESLRLRAP